MLKPIQMATSTRLDDQEDRRAEEAGEALRLAAEPVAAEDRGQVEMRRVEAEAVVAPRRVGGRHGVRGQIR